MKAYLTPVEEVLRQTQSSLEGLSSLEAENRLQKNGKNKLKEADKISNFQRFLNELKDPMLIILMVAAVISAVTSSIDRETPTDAIIIMIVVFLNAILGVYLFTGFSKYRA